MTLREQMREYVLYALVTLDQGVHGQQATDVVAVRPDRKQLAQVAFFQRIVKSVFSFLGCVVGLGHNCLSGLMIPGWLHCRLPESSVFQAGAPMGPPSGRYRGICMGVRNIPNCGRINFIRLYVCRITTKGNSLLLRFGLRAIFCAAGLIVLMGMTGRGQIV